MRNPYSDRLTDGLRPYVTGPFFSLINAPTAHRPEDHAVDFSLRDLLDGL